MRRPVFYTSLPPQDIPSSPVGTTTPTLDIPYAQNDATRSFAERLADPSRWIIKKDVPVFKPHERTDPNTGKHIKVDVTKLQRIAYNMQQMERNGGVPIRMTIGHTEPNKPEVQQPPLAGFYRNARVERFGPSGEPAIVVDEWLDPQFLQHRKHLPYRSSEYYDDTEQITGVALLSRDPFLDLGIVAYSKGETPTFYGKPWKPSGGTLSYTSAALTEEQATHYQRAGQRVPTLYRQTLGDVSMWPNGQPPQNGQTWTGPAVPAQPVPQPNTPPPQGVSFPSPPYPQPVPQPQVPAQYQAPQTPTPYGWSSPTPYWDGTQPRNTNYPQEVPHQHLNTGAVYGRNNQYGRQRPGSGGYGRGQQGRYASYDDQDGSGPPPSGPPMSGSPSMGPGGGGSMAPPSGPPMSGGPGMGGGGNVMEELYNCLSQAVQIISQELGAGPAGPSVAPMPPNGPFPAGPGGPPPTQAGRYGRSQYGRHAPRRYSNDGRQPTNYTDPQRVPDTYPRTISGLPVGYQLKIDQLEAKNRQLTDAMNVVMYERDQADTQACAAEITRLSQAGYQVSEYDFRELKKKNPQERSEYISHICTHYQCIGTQPLPVMQGDPTPGPQSQPGPLSREQMNQLLSVLPPNATPAQYAQAVEAVRYGHLQINTGPFGASSVFNNPEANNVLDGNYNWGAGQAAPQAQPQLQPGMNQTGAPGPGY